MRFEQNDPSHSPWLTKVWIQRHETNVRLTKPESGPTYWKVQNSPNLNPHCSGDLNGDALVDYTNKIFQNRFGVVLQLIFLSTKIGCTINKKWCLWNYNYLLFSGQVWKMWLGHIAKYGPKTHFQLKMAFFWHNHRMRNCFFVKKITSDFLDL